MYTHRGAYLNALGEVIETGMRYDDRYLWTLPMFHCNGWCFTWGVTAVGGTHVCLRKVEPARIWELFDAEGVTHYSGAPDGPHRPGQRREGAPARAAGDRADRGRAALADAARPARASSNFRPIHVYGLTETYGPITVCAWHPRVGRAARRRAGAAPRPPGPGLRDAPTSCAWWTRDERRAARRRDDGRGRHARQQRDGATSSEPEATEEAFAGGWFHSGDIAVWHPDGYVELRDREKDIIISGGENISTHRGRAGVSRAPGRAGVRGRRHPGREVGRAAEGVRRRSSRARQATEEEIIEFCKEHIARFKAPAAVEFGELPKTSTGKVQKFVLREKEWDGREKQRVN